LTRAPGKCGWVGSLNFLKNCRFRFFKYFRIEELSVPILGGKTKKSETKNHRFCLFRKTQRMTVFVKEPVKN
jgi:hypothetical protein